MKYLKQFCIISVFSFAGEILNKIIPLPVPASIYGIILLFICLELKVVKVEHIKETSEFLIEIMPIMFVPASAGLIQSWGLIKSSLPIYLLITIISTFIVMAVSGLVSQTIIKHNGKRSGNNGKSA